MNNTMIAAIVTALFSTAGMAQTGYGDPAWKEPGFVMEEVVVTAKAPSDPAWQESGFVMEEVVVKATPGKLAEATPDRAPPRLRPHIAAHLRQQLLR